MAPQCLALTSGRRPQATLEANHEPKRAFANCERLSRPVDPQSDPTIDASIVLEKLYKAQYSHICTRIDLLDFTTTNGSAMA